MLRAGCRLRLRGDPLHELRDPGGRCERTERRLAGPLRDGGRTVSRPTEIAALGRNSFTVRLTDPDQPGLPRDMARWSARPLSLLEPGNPIKVIRSEDGGRAGPRRFVSTGASANGWWRRLPPSGPTGSSTSSISTWGRTGSTITVSTAAGGPPYAGTWQLVLAIRRRCESWEESVVEDELVPSERFIVFTPPYPAIAVDQDSGRIYAGFQDSREGDRTSTSEPRERRRRLGGPVRVNDTQVGDGAPSTAPRSLSPQRPPGPVYYDRREDPKDILNEVSYQASFDEGESFSERVPISDESFSSRIGFGSDRAPRPRQQAGPGLHRRASHGGLVGHPRGNAEDEQAGHCTRLVWVAIRRGWRAGSRPSCAGAGSPNRRGARCVPAPGARARQAVRPGRAR